MIAPIHPHLHIKQKREESNDKVELTNQKNQTIISHVTQSWPGFVMKLIKNTNKLAKYGKNLELFGFREYYWNYNHMHFPAHVKRHK